MRVKVKRSGAIFIATTIFLGVAGANTANNLLYIIVSAMLSLMLISGLSSIVNLRNVRIRVIPPKEAFAGRNAPLRVVLWSEGRMPSFLIRVSSEVDSALWLVVNREAREKDLAVVFDNRGKVEKIRLFLSSDFPLGMFVRYTEIEVRTDFVVFPAPIPTEEVLLSSGAEKETGDSLTAQNITGYEDIKGIREYRNDPMRLIHWKLSAKTEELLVKDMTEDTKKPIVLSIDMVSGDIERRLSKLTYLTIKYIEEGYPVGLDLGDVKIPPRRGEKQKALILNELALH